ncbi:hypothetical protein [Christiangramia forsetii]|uniref:Secreted protein n=2 Tax=Christiangramia forsetii TaxID=411153 RepID=A0M7G5_CHRFK|nr:hypothetical protein [Christiangramia forsetii]GGG27962.1 hypothetical protein GCM10011532_09140 [Christiangramia forsetii]CAL68560.1 secreted protein [Christiangramia forsetii KT0803]
MKKYFILLVALSFTLISCHSPSYVFDRTSSNYFKFPKGNYLLNTIDAPEAVRLDMQEMIFEEFGEEIGQKNITSLQKATIRIIPSKIHFHPDQETIKEWDQSTGNYDYIINIIAEKESDDVQSMVIGNLDPSDKNIVTVGMEIINLNDQASIFFSQVRAELSDNNDTKDFSFAVSSNTMLNKSLKKILRRI